MNAPVSPSSGPVELINASPSPAPGPVEVTKWPRQLRARVTTPGPAPLLHGYDVEGDLARHYGLTELFITALLGEPPAPETTRAVEIALSFFAPLSVAHASTHSAVLARLCGATTSATISVSAVALAEQARVLLDHHVAWLAWLASPNAELPEPYRATSPTDTASVERLRALIEPTGLKVPWLDLGPTRDAALLGVLYQSGFTQRERIETLLVVARLPVVLAEAFAEQPANFVHYPTDLPAYRYEDPT